jgi:hypothetical protein
MNTVSSEVEVAAVVVGSVQEMVAPKGQGSSEGLSMAGTGQGTAAGATKSPRYIGEEEAAKMLDLSVNQFKRLTLRPPPFGSGVPVYDSLSIERLVGDPRVKAVQPKRRSYTKKAREFWNAYCRHHEVDWRSSLANSCAKQASMDSHYRHAVCRDRTREELDANRRMLVNLLCDEGFLVDVVQNRQPGKGGLCFACGGTGKKHGEECQKCHGTGQWTPVHTRIDFRFIVDGRRFSFRLRDNQINFRYHVANQLSPGGWGPLDPVAYPRHWFTEGKQCVRWVLDEHLKEVLYLVSKKKAA